MRRHAVSLTVCAGLLLGAQLAIAQDQSIIDAARREGRVVWYTTQIVNQVIRPMAAKFEARYGVKVDYVRADATDIAVRVVNETKGAQYLVDVIDGTQTAGLKKQGLLMKWQPEAISRFPKDYADPEGYWVATNLYIITPGFNTDLVKRGTEPRNWNDLLDPKWKGKLAWKEGASIAASGGFVGLAIAEMGEEKAKSYLKALAKQNVAPLGVGARQVLDQVVAGEYAISLQIFNNHAVISSQQGAPVDWIPMNPAMGVFSISTIAAKAPHPNAAKLLIDYMISDDGQAIMRDADYIPVAPNVPPRVAALRPDGKAFRSIYFTPEFVESNIQDWQKMWLASAP